MTTPVSQSPQPAPAGVDYPGKTLGIVGLIVAIFFNLIGLIISAIALNQSKKAGYKNTPALAGVIVGSILLVIGIIFAIIGIVAGIGAASMSTTY
jgi:Ca2+/H+ antiporter